MKPIYGKILGAILGFIFGGPMGAVVGFILGHLHDSRPRVVYAATGSGGRARANNPFQPDDLGDFRTQQAAFITGIVVLGAKMAKADGRVTRQEVDAFKRVFNIPDRDAARIGQMFDQARTSAEGYEPHALRLAQVFRQRPEVLEEVLTGLFAIAAADSNGMVSPRESEFLKRIAVLFSFGLQDFLRIAARSGVRLPEAEAPPRSAAPPPDSNYMILGVTPAATNDEIKQAYRKLIRTHHPDKLVAQGLPPEMIKQATEKMKRINAAYAEIAKAKGIK